MGMNAPIHEKVIQRLDRPVRVGGIVLDRIDLPHRLSDVFVVASIISAAYGAWRNSAEHERSPNPMAFNMRGVEPAVVAYPRRACT